MSQQYCVAPWWTFLTLLTAMICTFHIVKSHPIGYSTFAGMTEVSTYYPHQSNKDIDDTSQPETVQTVTSLPRKRRNVTLVPSSSGGSQQHKTIQIPFKVMPTPDHTALVGRECSGCKTLSNLQERMFQELQAKKRSANLTILALVAMIAFLIGIGIKCSHWCHEDIRIADDKHLKISKPPTIVFPKHEKKKKRKHGISDLGSAMAQMGAIPLAVLSNPVGFSLKPPEQPQRSVSSDNVHIPRRNYNHRSSLPGMVPRPRQGSVEPTHSPISEDVPNVTTCLKDLRLHIMNKKEDKLISSSSPDQQRTTKDDIQTCVSSPSSSGIVSRSDSGLETTPLIHNSPGLSPVAMRARDKSPRIYHGNTNLLALQSARLLLRSNSTSGSSAETIGTISTSISSMTSSKHMCQLKGSDGSEFDPDSVDGTGTENSQEDTGLSSTTSFADDFAMCNSMDKDILSIEIPGFDNQREYSVSSLKSPDVGDAVTDSPAEASDRQSSHSSSRTGTLDSAIFVGLASSRSLGSICEDSDSITDGGSTSSKNQRPGSKSKCVAHTNLACIPSPSDSDVVEDLPDNSVEVSNSKRHRSRTASGDTSRSNGNHSQGKENKSCTAQSHDFTNELLSRLEKLSNPSNGCNGIKPQNGLYSKHKPRRSWCIADSQMAAFRKQLDNTALTESC